MGILTIGVGHTTAAGGLKVVAGMSITRQQAFDMLRADLRKFMARCETAMPTAATHEIEGATSFDFNTGAINKASWVMFWGAGQSKEARRRFLLWNKAGGKRLRGLAARRAREADIIFLNRWPESAPQTPAVSIRRRGEYEGILAKLGYLNIEEQFDGADVFAAVKAFQRDKGLVVDGIRKYMGTETQLPDELIIAKEGTANTPAYRGTCYIVLERLPVADFGAQPQITAEVFRSVGALELQIGSMALHPDAGEFGFDTLEQAQNSEGEAQPENRHVLTAATDFSGAMDERQALAPNLGGVSLHPQWFVDDLRCGVAQIKPAVRDKKSSIKWSCHTVDRPSAERITRLYGLPIFGGTPDDAALARAALDLGVRGMGVTISPKLTPASPASKGWVPIAATADVIVHAPELHLAVGLDANGHGITSRDLMSWSAPHLVPVRAFSGICWSPKLALFVAVAADASGGTIYSSADGITWVQRSSISGRWQSVVWSEAAGLFVAIGLDAPHAIWSHDGVLWTAGSAPANSWSSLVYAPALAKFVALTTASSRQMMESADGKTWIDHSTAISGVTGGWQNNLTWSEDLGLFATINSFISSAKLCTSSDGINWTVAVSLGASFQKNVVAGAGELLAITSYGNRILHSTDGVAWHDVSAGEFSITGGVLYYADSLARYVNGGLNLLDALMPGVVVSDALSTPPASPAAGACYIVAATATGTWAGWEGNIAAHIGGAWVRIIPQEGWVFWVVSNSGQSAFEAGAWVKLIEEAPSDGAAYARKNGAWIDAATITGGAHPVPLSFEATPTSSQILARQIVLDNITFPAHFAGSVGRVGTNPTLSFVIDVADDGVSIGTITIDSLGAVSFSTTGGVSASITSGSLITMTAPAVVDATISGLAVALAPEISIVGAYPAFSGQNYDLALCPSIITSLWQDAVGTIPVTADGDPIGRIDDQSGKGHHAVQATAAARPVYRSIGGLQWVDFAGGKWMNIAGFDLTASDKLALYAGVYKSSDAVQEIVVEHSADTNINIGAFHLLVGGPHAAGPMWSITYASNSGVVGVETAANYAAPLASAITAKFDIGGSSESLTTDGTTVINTTSVGVGNFSNNTLYIGARGGTSLNFGGRIYSLMIKTGTAAPADTAYAEGYVATSLGR